MISNFFVVTIIITIVFACEKKNDNLAVITKSIGNKNEVLLVIDDSLWVGKMGDSIRAILAQPVLKGDYFEPIFNLVQLDPKIFSSKAKTSRNIVLFSTNSQNEFLLQKSLHATPQNFFFVRAQNNHELLKSFLSVSYSIIKVFKSSELKEDMHHLVRSSTKPLTELKELFGCTMKIPDNYHLQVKLDYPFLWYQKKLATGNVNLIMYEFKISEIETSNQEIIKSIINARNIVGKEIIHTAKDSAYVTTNQDINPVISKEVIQSLPTYRILGNWITVNDYLRGPFISYAIKDEYYDRYLFIDGYVNNPFKEKRNHLLELEAIIKTINFNED